MYKLPKLPYLFQDLEPFIDTHTMGLHYHKHEQNYLNKLNEILEKNNYDYKYNLYELLYNINEFPVDDREDLLFNLGGVLNHNLYWKSMNNEKRQKPIEDLKEAIDKKYGSFKEFFAYFKKIALKLKGSGYTFLVMNKHKEIDVINTSNQDTPLLKGYIPLFVIDLWEHAYYINYENDKIKYIDNFEIISDFRYANKIYNNIKNTD